MKCENQKTAKNKKMKKAAADTDCVLDTLPPAFKVLDRNGKAKAGDTVRVECLANDKILVDATCSEAAFFERRSDVREFAVPLTRENGDAMCLRKFTRLNSSNISWHRVGLCCLVGFLGVSRGELSDGLFAVHVIKLQTLLSLF